VQYALANPGYYGLIRFNDELYEGVHKPLVSKSLFDRVQSVRHDRGKHRRHLTQVKAHPLRGLFRCGECGCQITIEKQKGLTYLRCTKKKVKCSQRYVREEAIIEQMSATIRSLSLPREFADRLFDKHVEEFPDMSRLRMSNLAEVQRTIDAFQHKLDRLSKRYLDNEFSRDEYLTLKNPLLQKQADLKEKFERESKNPEGRHQSARTFLNACIQAFSISQTTDLRLKVRFIKSVGSNLKILDRKINLCPLGSWKIVALYGPLRDDRFWVERVSDEIDGDYLLGAGSGWLVEPYSRKLPDRDSKPVADPTENRT
jgi:hypothetical protein